MQQLHFVQDRAIHPDDAKSFVNFVDGRATRKMVLLGIYRKGAHSMELMPGILHLLLGFAEECRKMIFNFPEDPLLGKSLLLGNIFYFFVCLKQIQG